MSRCKRAARVGPAEADLCSQLDRLNFPEPRDINLQARFSLMSMWLSAGGLPGLEPHDWGPDLFGPRSSGEDQTSHILVAAFYGEWLDERAAGRRSKPRESSAPSPVSMPESSGRLPAQLSRHGLGPIR